MKKVLPILIAFLGLSGCANWPQHGHSGAAELSISFVGETPEQVRLFSAQKKLIALEEQGAKDYFPAAFIITNIQLSRATRTVQGGFLKSSRTDLDKLDALIQGLRANLRQKHSLRAELLP
ncbi:MAG: hypothetical protein COB59_03895 [Rhodospirillaceae bacterium]|nr:MAG: hypothetical protein COB59_03895 [Rhodospirillaceae bacterium]